KMKRFFRNITMCLLGTLVLSSCQEVVELDVPTSDPTVVIVGRVTDASGPRVTVSVTAPYFSQAATPKINDARVTLFEDGVMVSELTRDTIDGAYSSGYIASVGRTYEIQVEIPAGSKHFRESSWRSLPELLRP